MEQSHWPNYIEGAKASHPVLTGSLGVLPAYVGFYGLLTCCAFSFCKHAEVWVVSAFPGRCWPEVPVSLFGVLSCIVVLADNPDASLGSLLCAVAFICYCSLRSYCVFCCYVLWGSALSFTPIVVLFDIFSSNLPRPFAGIPPAILDDYFSCCSNWF